MSRPLCWSLSVVQLLELYSAYFLELLQQLAELHSTAGVPLTPTDGILQSGHTLADGQLQNDDSCK